MRAQTLSTYKSISQDAVSLILNDLDGEHSCRSIGERFAVSPFFFHRLFKAVAGESPMEMLKRLRLERSTWQLTSSETPVTEIAFDAGFDSLEGFSREFKRRFGRSPRAFREERLIPQHLDAPNNVHWGLRFIALEGKKPMTDTTVNYQKVSIESVRVSAFRHLGPYQQIGQTFSRMRPAPGPRRMFAIYYDNPEVTPAEQLRSDACCEIKPGESPLEGAADTEIQGGSYAVYEYTGPYPGIGDAWTRFMKALAGEEVTYRDAPPFEEYLNNPMTTPPGELKTALFAPVA